MATTQINCPNCGQSIKAEVNQILDLNTNPNAKGLLLSGNLNAASCPHCGFVGMLATPIVYHDPGNEILLTFVPQDLNISRDEQERIIGPMIKNIMDSLEPERRKAYLLNPTQVFTFQGLVEKVLEFDGITKDMLEEQNRKLKLLEQMIDSDNAELSSLISENDTIIDQEFFSILSHIVQGAVNSNDKDSAQKLVEIQEIILGESTYGKKVKNDIEVLQGAANELQSLGETVSKDDVIRLLTKDTSETRIRAFAQLARPLFDYEFFQLISSQIDQADDSGKETLSQIRDQLLAVTTEIDNEINMRSSIAKKNIEQLLESENVEEIISQNINSIDEIFIHVLRDELDLAEKSGEIERAEKIKKVFNILDGMSSESGKIKVIEELLTLVGDEDRFDRAVEIYSDSIDDDFVQTITGLISQVQESTMKSNDQDQKIILEKLQFIHQRVLNYKMSKAFNS